VVLCTYYIVSVNVFVSARCICCADVLVSACSLYLDCSTLDTTARSDYCQPPVDGLGSGKWEWNREWNGHGIGSGMGMDMGLLQSFARVP